MALDKILTVLGRMFIGAGVLVFLFVAFQLWGTGITEAKNQDKLQEQAKSELNIDINAPIPTTEPGAPTNTTVNTTPAPPPAPMGSAVAVIKIPKINVEKAVVEGTGVEDLKKAPGHYNKTPLPGQPGNAAIAGHRTTYGAPFGDLGELVPGDEILVATKQGKFRYIVSEQKVVDPTNVSVLNPTNDNRLTLTTCHPKYSAAKRLIVIAKLDTNPAPAAPPTTVPPTTTPPAGSPQQLVTTTTPTTVVQEADLSGTSTDKLPALIWALITAAVGMVIWVISVVWRKWPAFIIGTPFFLVCLFFFFENFSRLLPANA